MDELTDVLAKRENVSDCAKLNLNKKTNENNRPQNKLKRHRTVTRQVTGIKRTTKTAKLTRISNVRRHHPVAFQMY